jgi:hypothetical protein
MKSALIWKRSLLVVALFSGVTVFSGVAVPLFAADPPVATAKSDPTNRLAYMQWSGESYTVTVGNTKKATFQKEPILRFTNSVSGVVDAGLFVWRDEQQCPVAAAQFFICPGTEDLWLHEFQSLTVEPLKFDYRGIDAWAPQAAGIQFDSLENVEAPANTTEGRLVQMRQIARRFTVEDDFARAGDDHLRLLSTPITRYKSDKLLDGAIFAFAHGTDPELFLILEAQQEDSKKDTKSPINSTYRWRVALAPMTSYAIKAKLDGKDYWSVPLREAPHAVDATFRDIAFPPTR